MYMYQAALWCDECGRAICERLTAEGKAPADPEDERTFDSGEFPKRFLEGGESDSVDFCDAGAECLAPLDLRDYGLSKRARMVGAETPLIGRWLENGLTAEGRKGVREFCADVLHRTAYQRALQRFYWSAYPEAWY